MRVLFAGFPHSAHYASVSQSAWSAGEVREVSEIEAAYLFDNFGVAFELVPEKTIAVAPAASAVDRAMRTPRRARG